MATAGANSFYDCPICCERYKNPKIISCGHSFCLNPCLHNLMKSDSVNCPLCRTPIQIPLSGKAEDLPTNFALQSVTEAHTSNLETLTVLQGSNGSTQAEQKSCLKHEQNFVVYCETCSELLCSKCLDECHHETHDTMDVQETVDTYCGRLDIIAEEVTTANKKLDEIFSSLGNSKERCKAEADSVITTIDKAAEAVIQQVRERVRELHLEVDQKKCTVLKNLKEVEARGTELSLFFNYTRITCEHLKSELMLQQFKRRSAVDIISHKTTTSLNDLSELEKEAVKDPDSSVFTPSQQLSIPIGEVIDSSEENGVIDSPEGNKSLVSLSKVKDLSFLPKQQIYVGFIFVNTNAITFVCTPELCSNKLRLSCRYGQSQRVLPDVVAVSPTLFLPNISLTSVNTSNQKAVVVSSSHEALKITVNIEDVTKLSTTSSVRLSDDLLYKISAVTLDEMGENCYALLDDGYTIKLFNFVKRTDTFHMRLEEKVEGTNSRRFHVTKFGMVISEEDKIRFYETAKTPRTTRIIRGPSGITKGRPVCITSQEYDKKWFVLWTTNTGPVSSSIYQYSASFQMECLLLKLLNEKVESFYILDEKYLALDIREKDKIKLSVYYINRGITKNPLKGEANSNI